MASISTTTRKTAAKRTRPDHPDLGPVEQIPIDLLKPFPGNARTHNKAQLFKIGQSLETFGWMNPVIAELDGTIIAGHGRWLAAKSLGYTHCAVIRAEHLTPGHCQKDCTDWRGEHSPLVAADASPSKARQPLSIFSVFARSDPPRSHDGAGQSGTP